jgi:hypothetical protein
MRLIKTKKGAALIVALVVVAASAIGAYAYFTSTGTGSGTATVGTSGGNIYVTGSTGGTLYPGGPTQTLSFSAKNFANFGQSITNIHATGVAACVSAWSSPSLASYPVAAPTCSDTGADALSDAACDTSLTTGVSNVTSSALWIPDVAVSPTADGHLAPNANRALTTAGTVTLNDTGANQDPCKLKNLSITFTTT